MKISKTTFSILRNFAAINQSLYVVPGKKIITVVPGQSKDMFAIAEVEEEFPVEFAIYDLKKFRECAGLFTEPEFNFGDSSVVITDGKNRVNYVYSEKSILDIPDYNRTLGVKDEIAQFELKYSQIKMAIDASNILGIQDVLISGDNGVITMRAYSEEVKSSDVFDVVVAEGVECPNFSSRYSLEKLRKLIDADYQITVCRKVITEFKSPLVTYYTGGTIKVEE